MKTDKVLIMFVEGGYFASHTFFHQSIKAFSGEYDTIEFFNEPDWETPLPGDVSKLVSRSESSRSPFLINGIVRKSSSKSEFRAVRIIQNLTANCLYAAANRLIWVLNFPIKKKRVYFEICEKHSLDESSKSQLWKIIKLRPDTFWVLNVHQLDIALDIARYTKSKVIVELVDIHTEGSDAQKFKHIQLLEKADRVVVSSLAFAEYYFFRQNGIQYFHRFLVPSSTAKQISTVGQERRFIFFGNFSESRKIEVLLNVISKVDNAHFSFFGRFLTPEYEAQIRKYVLDMKLSHKVSFGFLEAEEDMISVCNKHDIGIILFDPNYNVSHQYALPTKLGTYLFSGLDVISVSNPPICAFSANEKHLSLMSAASPEELYRMITKKMNLSNFELELNKQKSLDYAKKCDWESSGKKSYLAYMEGKNDKGISNRRSGFYWLKSC